MKKKRVQTAGPVTTARCPFSIFDPTHYRANGSCRCDDAAHRKIMKSWGYTAKDFKGIPLRK